MLKFLYSGCAALLILLLSACATVSNDPKDPFESYNRKVYAFNTAIHNALYRPTSKAYNFTVPWPVRKGIINVFANLYQLPTIANDLLQGEVKLAMKDVGRFAVNSTIGIAGIFDVATGMGLERTYQDLGITLAKWGDRNAPFFMIPFFGPSTVRDVFGTVFDYRLFTIYPYIEPALLRYGLMAGEFFAYLAQYQENAELLEDVELDPYVLQKDIYFQRREYLINQRLGAADNIYIEALDDTSDDEEIGPFLYVDEE